MHTFTKQLSEQTVQTLCRLCLRCRWCRKASLAHQSSCETSINWTHSLTHCHRRERDFLLELYGQFTHLIVLENKVNHAGTTQGFVMYYVRHEQNGGVWGLCCRKCSHCEVGFKIYLQIWSILFMVLLLSLM